MKLVVKQLFFLLVSSALLVQCKWIDMSWGYKNNTRTWIGVIPYRTKVVSDGPLGGFPYVLAFNMEFNEHTGTHIDAPVHFVKGKLTVDQITPENLIGEAIVVNITEQASKDRDYALAVKDLEDWESKHGKIPDGSIVFILTGQGKYWGDFDKYMGIDVTNGTTSFHFPGIHEEAAKWLVTKRKIKGVGLDSRSLDVGKSHSGPAHQIILGANIYGLECVANIEKLPPKGAIVYVMPMKITGGSGGPARIFAQTDPVGRSSYFTVSIFCVLLMTVLSSVIAI